MLQYAKTELERRLELNQHLLTLYASQYKHVRHLRTSQYLSDDLPSPISGWAPLAITVFDFFLGSTLANLCLTFSLSLPNPL
jgi:hypothetical protein